MSFNIEALRNQFPILERKVNGQPLVYFDNGATAQKPKVMIDALENYYNFQNSNIHRGVHTLSQEATTAFEAARTKAQAYFNAAKSEEIIFTKGTTDGINLIAGAFGRTFLHDGDEVIISTMEHHSNIVPWQMICDERKAKLRIAPINEKGELLLDELKQMVNAKTKLISIVHISNALGTINPVKDIIDFAHANDTLVLVDGAQSVPHMKIDLQAWDCDFFVFSAHKMFGPTGIGVLYGKEHLLNEMPPYQGGGDMIKTVSFEKTTYNELPHKFEAGTPNIAAGVALSATFDFLNELDWDAIRIHETELLDYATAELKKIDGLRIIGEAENKASVISFLVDGTHPFDLGVILDQMGIAVRTGHHCTQPLMDWYKIPGTIRASFAIYNTKEEVDRMIVALNRAVKMLR